MRFFILSVIPLGLLADIGTATAAQDTPQTSNGVTAVCTGVGSAKDNPQWADYPVKLVLANGEGQNVAAAKVTLSRNGQTVMATECDAPWLLLKAPSGTYTASAQLPQGSGSTEFSTNGQAPQKEVTLMVAQKN